jgi:hypothetical protein
MCKPGRNVSGHTGDVVCSALISLMLSMKCQCLLDNYFMYLEYFHYHKIISVPMNCGGFTRLTTRVTLRIRKLT